MSADPDRPGALRVLALGVAAGCLLGAGRAPLGLDLVRAVAVDGPTAAVFRAGALLLLAAALARAPLLARSGRAGALLAGLAVGLVLQRLFLACAVHPATRVGVGLELALCALVLWLLGRRGGAPAAASPRDPALVSLGLLAAGAGAACGVELVARALRQLSFSHPQEEGVAAATFALAAAFGAAALGPLAPRTRWREAAAVLVAAGTLVCGVGLQRLHELGRPGALADTVNQVGSLFVFADAISSPLRVDVWHLGTWRVTAALAAACLFAPALALGGAMAAVERGPRLAWLAAGAAAGTLALPLLLLADARPASGAELEAAGAQSRMLALCVWTASAGGALVLLRAPRGAHRLAAAAALAAIAAAPLALAPDEARLFTPWQEIPRIEPKLAIDAPEGLLTVEYARTLPAATLDRMRLTPVPVELEGDELRIRRSLALLDGGGAGARVLLVGELTRERVDVLATYEGLSVERTSVWWRHSDAVARALLGDAPPPPPALSPAEATRRLRAGEFDLVLVLPARGQRLPTLPAHYRPAPAPAPLRGDWSVPAGTLGVVWVDAGSDLSTTDLGERVIVVASPLEQPSLGLVTGASAATEELPRGAPATLGSPRLLDALGWNRLHRARAAAFARLARANATTEWAQVLEFFALHYGAQTESSPFLTHDERVEIEPRALEALRDAALGEEPGGFVRDLVSDVAIVLTNKRRPDLVLEYVEPIAEARPEWEDLDRSLLLAYVELDVPEEVDPLLARVLERDPYDIRLLLLAAEWEDHRDRPESAQEMLDRAVSLQPRRPDLLRLRADFARRWGHPDAEEWERRAAAASEPDGD